MIRQIVKDVLFLEQKSEPATIQDKSIVTDLVDTLKANLRWMCRSCGKYDRI